MSNYNPRNRPPPGQPVFRPPSAEQERENAICVARNHLRHPERVSIKVLLWARKIVEDYDRKQKLN